MACAHPLTIRPRYREWTQSNLVTYSYFPRDYQVPCGYCVNCRKDYQNYIIDRANYEYCKRLTAAFVTVTYDDIHLIDRCAVTDQFGFVYDTNSKGEKCIRTSLNYDDITHFISSIRSHIYRHPEIHNILCQPDFAYLYCGEYGDCFGRCHAHFLFFGLDFAYCKKIFQSKWKFGLIDVLPLLDGGINYVLKYLDKEVKFDLAVEKYDRHLLARPARFASIGFGASLYYDNVKDIKSNGMTYQSGQVRRPVPPYYKKVILGDISPYNHPFLSDSRQELLSSISRTMSTDYHQKPKSLKFRHSTKDIQAFRLRMARNRERKLRQKILNDGVGVFDYLNYDDVYFSPKRSKVKTLNIDIQRWLSEEYRNSLSIGGSA